MEPRQEQFHIVAVNRSAHALGIEPGLELSAALVLSGSLKVVERSLQSERACLEALAAWAQRITPVICIEPPESLLLEVAGSIELFGGLLAIKKALSDEIENRRLSFQLCAAPTALASLWLARNRSDDALSQDQLARRIGSLPLQVTRWPNAIQTLLKDMGIRTVSDCFRLPRDGFARRVGQGYLEDLDKVLGKRFDLRPGFKVPERWSSKIELFEETSEAYIFIEAIDKMLDGLVAKLRKHQSQVQSLSVSFEHLHRHPTVEHFDLIEPSHQKDRLLNLIGDRLERVVLPVPAVAVGLSTDSFRPMSFRDPGLFAATSVEASASVLIERLRGRFGVNRVYGVGLVAEHRPEYAWSKVVDEIPGSSAETAAVSPWARCRPLWVLPSPLPLSSCTAQFHYKGSLQLRSEPERIESGWWDDKDVSRDYYTAIGACGRKLWIYQDRVGTGWYLHGIFG